ncbi:RNA polymerase sigma factor [Sphingobacterium sp. LRF_L2]|uniref:RNA polymerase sigma factor n=1 Tax=Sphingobacterium sp. LRF_L2 TaxID=3369421 RepID=UPI003F628BC0
MSLNEKHILTRLAKGDTDAFARLFCIHWKTVYRLCYKYTGSHFDAEDISQEVFQRIWEKRKFLMIQTTFERYIIRATKNSILNHFRATETKKKYEKDANWYTSQYTTVLDVRHLKHAENKYHELVALLPARSHEIYRRKTESHITNDALAKEMGLSIKTIEYHLHRANKFIREGIKKNQENF